MNTFNINALLRSNIRKLIPYSSARADFKGNADIFLDANENNLGSSAYNRYPDPTQQELKHRISELKDINPENIFIGNGSDEPIDLLMRAFCEPGKDNIMVFPPTYGMYSVAANINDIEVREVPLNKYFTMNVAAAMDKIDVHTKLIFICSPNNPTGNLIPNADIEIILNSFEGIVVIDEAYQDFSGTDSWIEKLSEYPNLVVLQTFSKAWGLAGLRIGVAYTSGEIIQVLTKIKAPYNISSVTQKLALEAILKKKTVDEWIGSIISEREILEEALQKLPFVQEIYPSDANFLLVKVMDGESLYAHLAKEGIIVRNRSNMPGCENCLRITVGMPEENMTLLKTLNNY